MTLINFNTTHMPKKFLTVKEVSRLLGVTPLTIRNWDQKGKLAAYRHPINNYRMYKTADVENLLKQIEDSSYTKQPAQKIKKLKVEY